MMDASGNQVIQKNASEKTPLYHSAPQPESSTTAKQQKSKEIKIEFRDSKGKVRKHNHKFFRELSRENKYYCPCDNKVFDKEEELVEHFGGLDNAQKQSHVGFLKKL